MKTLSKEELTLSEWVEAKPSVYFCWLKTGELACAYSCKNEKTFLISYSFQSHELNYYSWEDRDDRDLISIFVTHLPKNEDCNVQTLLCPNYLSSLIEDRINGKN